MFNILNSLDRFEKEKIIIVMLMRLSNIDLGNFGKYSVLPTSEWGGTHGLFHPWARWRGGRTATKSCLSVCLLVRHAGNIIPYDSTRHTPFAAPLIQRKLARTAFVLDALACATHYTQHGIQYGRRSLVCKSTLGHTSAGRVTAGGVQRTSQE